MRITFLLICVCFLCSKLMGQPEKRALFPPPNTANLQSYKQIQVDKFTGLPDVSVPLLNFTSRDLSIPVGLKYNASIVKPSTQNGWVGLGWSLDAGGVITRNQNDIPDEYISYINGVSNAVPCGFFYHYGILAGSDWTTTKMFAEFDTLFGFTATGSYRRDKAPDEFAFNFLGYSGSMFMGQDGQWKLKCNQGIDFNVQFEFGNYAVREIGILYPSIVRNCITRIILTAGDGTKYYFGGDKAIKHPTVLLWNFYGGDSTSIEFNRMGVGTGDFATRDGGTVPTSWYLTKIKSVTGDSIKLEYTRHGYQIVSTGSSFGSEYQVTQSTIAISPGSSRTVVPVNDQVYILDPVYLSKITGANGSLVFNKSEANVLDYQLFGPANNAVWQQLKDAYHYEVFWGDNNNYPSSTWMKLNEIVLKNSNDQTLRSYVFNYTESATNRLFLSGVRVKDADGTLQPPHSFGYYFPFGLEGVPYSTLKVDHQGYYNGVDPINGVIPGFPSPLPGGFYYNDYGYGISMFTPAMATAYKARREPVESAMVNGMLIKIIYPTGGFTDLFYEPHTYSKALVEWPLAITDLNVNKQPGGMRIRKIIDQTDPTSTQMIKEYFYVRDYVNNGTLSSGVLNSAEPQYVEDANYQNHPTNPAYTIHYRIWSSNNKFPQHYTNGHHITYSHVTEVSNDGSFTIYNYTNHDNGYLNQPFAAAVTTNYTLNELSNFSSSSMALERGLLLSRKNYRNDKLLLHKVDYEYNNDPNRLNVNIRRYFSETKLVYDGSQFAIGNEQIVSKPFQVGLSNIIAQNIYIHYPYLKKITETRYDQAGANPVVDVREYTYDSYRNTKTETAISSKNESIINSFNYPTDNIAGLSTEAQTAKNAMVAAHIISPLLEQITTRNAVQTSKMRNNYKLFENSSIFNIPANKEQAFKSNALEKEIEYVNFDSKGNLLQFNTRNNIPTSFQWDHDQSYPTVKVQNASNSLKITASSQDITATNNLPFFVGPSSSSSPLQSNFELTRTGSIVLTCPSSGSIPPNSNIYVNFTINGPAFRSGNLCASANPGISCGGTTNTITFTNMPPGQYTLTGSVSTSFTSYSFGGNVNCSFPSVQITNVTSGIKEFFYQGFEEEPTASIANPYAGKKYYNGDYTVSYTMPNARPYRVNYHYLDNGVWKNMTKNYTNNMVLNEGTAIDEVRVYPADASMITFTYTPMVGMTSETDPNGKTIYYKYDAFQRLTLVFDQDRKILKKICYNYSGQADDCTTPSFTNDQQQGNFTSTASCPPGTVQATLTYTIAAGTYTSYDSKEVANQMAIEALNIQGQAAVNALGCMATLSALNSITAPWNVTVSNGTFNNTYSLYPNSIPTVIATLPLGTYTITVVPMYSGTVTSPVQLTLNGTNYTGTSFTINNVSITTNTSFTIQNIGGGPCSFSIQSGYTTPTNSISASGSTVSFYFVFFRNSSSMTVGNTYHVATINGGCRPSVTRTINYSTGGRSWTITIYPSGQMNWTLNSGPTLNAGSVVSTSTLSYSL